MTIMIVGFSQEAQAFELSLACITDRSNLEKGFICFSATTDEDEDFYNCSIKSPSVS